MVVFWIMVTVPFDNISEELIYMCITLSVLTLFIIVLVAAAAITTTTTIALLPAPLAFSKLTSSLTSPSSSSSPLRRLSHEFNSTVHVGYGRGGEGRTMYHIVQTLPYGRSRSISGPVVCEERVPTSSQ